MICPNCKKELADNANTCPQCGYSFIEKKIGNSLLRGFGCLGIIIFVVFIFLFLLFSGFFYHQ